MVTRKKAANRGNLTYRPTRQTIANRLLGVIVSDQFDETARGAPLIDLAALLCIVLSIKGIACWRQ